MSDVVSKLWGFCHTLRHDGIDYGDYIEQITFLLFLKMADEKGIEVPKGCDWPTLRDKAGSDLTDFYVDLLRKLAKQPGMLGDIFAESQSRFNNPVSLKKLINLIDEIEWTSLGVDVKAEAYEGLLEKAANEGKKGAGQYFTPRVLIQSIVRVMKPDPRTHKEFTICDPACGTGGFLVAAHEWLVAPKESRTAFPGRHEQIRDGLGRPSYGAGAAAMDRDVAKRVKKQTYFAQELVARPRRMALMNLYLHGVEPHITLGDTIYDPPSGERFGVILTNPPFGTKGANQAPTRDDSDPNGQSKPKRKDLGETGRFRRFHATEIAERSYKLDITWLKDESLESSDDLPDPQDLATEAITALEAIVGDLREIVALIEQEEGVET